MRHFINISAVLLLLVSFSFGQGSSEWFGYIHSFDGKKACRLKLSEDNNSFLTYGYISSLFEVKDFTANEKGMNWVAFSANSKYRFEGDLVNEGRLSGTYTHRGVSYEFQLQKRKIFTEDSLRLYTGYYQSPTGAVFQVLNNRTTLHIHSPISGEYLVLKGVSDNRFLTRSLEEFDFQVLVDGKFQSLSWRDANGQLMSARRFEPFQTESVTYVTRKDTIHGTLYLPQVSDSPSPCIMLALGAGRLDRWNYALEASIYASHGIASLIVDFPGTGESSGNVEVNTFEEKTNMTLDIFYQLQKHPSILSNKVAIRGGSQSGRIALMAAAYEQQVAAVVAVNPPVETYLETQLFAIEQFLRSRGIDEITNIETTQLWNRYYQQVHQQAISQDLVDDIQKMASAHEGLYLPPFQTTELPLSPHQEDIMNTPLHLLEKIHCPVLFQFGMLDERVPVQTAIRNINHAITKNPYLAFTIIQYPTSNHSMMRPGYQIAQNFFMHKIEWLKEALEV